MGRNEWAGRLERASREGEENIPGRAGTTWTEVRVHNREAG